MNIDNYIMACHFIGDLPPHRGLFTRGLALLEGRACPCCPHPGLVPLIAGLIRDLLQI